MEVSREMSKPTFHEKGGENGWPFYDQSRRFDEKIEGNVDCPRFDPLNPAKNLTKIGSVAM